MANLIIAERSDIVSIANAVRNKTGQTNEMTLGGIIAGINGISTGTDTSDATATSGDILSGKTAYVDGEKITGVIETATQATPSISVSSSGLITASATQTAGYVTAGTKSGTKQLTTQAAKTVTPTTSNQTAVASGRYTTGAVTIKGDANLKAENIKSGVSIFGVTGTASGSEDLDTELTKQESLISQLGTILDSKASGGSGGVSTCNIDIVINATIGVTGLKYSYLENGTLTATGVSYNSESWLNNTTIHLQDILCGSLICIQWSSAAEYSYGDNVEKLKETHANGIIGDSDYYWIAPVTNGATGTIYLLDDD